MGERTIYAGEVPDRGCRWRDPCTGDVAILDGNVIHSVVNPLSQTCGAIHVYGGDFFAAHRSMWDAETLTEAPYDYDAVTKRTPNSISAS